MVINIFCIIILFVFILLALAIRWMLGTWQHLTMEELIYHLNAPLEGTNNDLIIEFVKKALVPAIVLVILIVLIPFVIKKVKKCNILRKPFLVNIVAAVIVLVWSGLDAWTELDIGTYLMLQAETSDFIAETYADPVEVKITFPEKKKNLIYIFLESMETTYADIDAGGGFEENCIPELTSLAMEGEDFSGSTDSLNGGHALPGATWTIAGMFAQSSGLPLKISIDENGMDTQSSFFSGLACLGDILEAEDYTQMLMVGSEAAFGGRELYYTQHGNYTIRDYNYAVDHNLIAKNYKMGSWGYEDAKLFEYAKEELVMLAEQEDPFCFTMLTVDTHFEDGTICALCQDSHGDNQYANVMACSSKQVDEFVRWIQEQSFYENTTVVIAGDHLTMDKDFCNEVDEEYTRKTYVSILNSATEVMQADVRREYSTFDLFPTTLAAMGVEIEGDRLGLGTNLYSAEETLLEKYGYNLLNEELRKDSAFLEEEANIDENDRELLVRHGKLPSARISVGSGSNESMMKITVSKLKDTIEDTERIYAVIQSEETQLEVELELQTDGNYCGEADISMFGDEYGAIEAYVQGISGTSYFLDDIEGCLSWMKMGDIYQYLERLSQENYAIFITTRDEPVTAINDEVMEALHNLGIQSELQGKYRCSFYAVISGSEVLENMAMEMISCEGVLSDGVTDYDIVSAGFDCGNYCSIEINGEEYVVGGRGMSIVVYDLTLQRVVDSVCFDTYYDLSASR